MLGSARAWQSALGKPCWSVSGVAVGVGEGVIVGSGVAVGVGEGVIVGSGVAVGVGEGVIVGSGVGRWRLGFRLLLAYGWFSMARWTSSVNRFTTSLPLVPGLPSLSLIDSSILSSWWTP